MKFFAFILTVTLITLPQFTYAQSLQAFFANLLTFTNDIIVPFILGIAFVIFIINAIRYFVIGSTSEEGRDKAKDLALYSVFAFFIIIIFWGVVNMLSSSIGLQGTTAPTPDYIEANP